MNTTASFSQRLGAFSRKLMGVAAFASLLGVGVMSAKADSPAFNGLSNDNPTLQVAKPGQQWGTSITDAQPGETVNLLVWDHNSVPGTTATNVRIRVALPTGIVTPQSMQAVLSADNAQAVTGTATVAGAMPFGVEYIPGTAKFLRNVNGQLTYVNWPTGVNPDDVVAGGVNVGNQDGCWQYTQAVLLQVRLTAGNAAISTNKKVAFAGGQGGYADSITAQPGDVVDYRIFLQNTGSATGTHPQITDTLDSRLTYIAGTSTVRTKVNNQDVDTAIADSAIAVNGKTMTWNFGNMLPRPDAALYLTFQARVAGTDAFQVGQTTIPNCALVKFDNASANTNCVNVVINKSVTPVVSFNIRKEVTNLSLGDSKWYDTQLASAAPGDTVAYRITVNNTGNVTANNVTVKDLLPSGLGFVPGSVLLYNRDHQNGMAIDDSLMAGGYTSASIANGNDNMQTFIFKAKITDNCSGSQTLTNVSQVFYQGALKGQDDATLVISCTRGLIISKQIKDSDGQFKSSIGYVHEGDVLTYRINVQNNGNVPVTNPRVRDILPAQVSYVQNSLAVDGEFMAASTQEAFLGNGMLLTNLNPGMGKVITFQVKVNDCPPFGDISLDNTAFVKADSVAEISSTAHATVQVRKPTLSF